MTNVVYVSLRFGYDTKRDALRACKAVATEHGVPLDEIVVLQTTFYRDLAGNKKASAKSPTRKAAKKKVAKKER